MCRDIPLKGKFRAMVALKKLRLEILDAQSKLIVVKRSQMEPLKDIDVKRSKMESVKDIADVGSARQSKSAEGFQHQKKSECFSFLGVQPQPDGIRQSIFDNVEVEDSGRADWCVFGKVVPVLDEKAKLSESLSEPLILSRVWKGAQDKVPYEVFRSSLKDICQTSYWDRRQLFKFVLRNLDQDVCRSVREVLRKFDEVHVFVGENARYHALLQCMHEYFMSEQRDIRAGSKAFESS